MALMNEKGKKAMHEGVRENTAIRKEYYDKTKKIKERYEKWLEDDSTKMQVTKTAIQELTQKLAAVHSGQIAHGAALENIEVVERLVRVEHQPWSDESSWLGEGHAEPDERVTKSQGPPGWE